MSNVLEFLKVENLALGEGGPLTTLQFAAHTSKKTENS
jgi:hypothetical protein